MLVLMVEGLFKQIFLINYEYSQAKMDIQIDQQQQKYI